jgi:hypothetical protein
MVEMAVGDQDALKSDALTLDQPNQPFRFTARIDGAGTTLRVPHEIAIGLQRSYGYAKHVVHSVDPHLSSDIGRRKRVRS